MIKKTYSAPVPEYKQKPKGGIVFFFAPPWNVLLSHEDFNKTMARRNLFLGYIFNGHK